MTRIVAAAVGVMLWVAVVGVQVETGLKAKDPALQAAIEGRQKAIDVEERNRMGEIH